VLWTVLGVNLTPIIVKKILRLEDLRGKSLAVDANNYLYQFLALIRTRDGTPLKDSHGNVTSHLAGLMFRSTRLMDDYDMDLVFVFDGEPPKLKEREILKRREIREKATREWEKALKAGDYATAFSKAVMTSRLTRQMVDDAQRLLELLGVPFVQAPSEAEAHGYERRCLDGEQSRLRLPLVRSSPPCSVPHHLGKGVSAQQRNLQTPEARANPLKPSTRPSQAHSRTTHRLGHSHRNRLQRGCEGNWA